MKSSLLRLALVILALACLPTRSWAQANQAQPPGQISFQGFLTDANGAPLGAATPQNFNVQFNIYAAPTGGTPLWGEVQVVTVSQGYFTVLLGVGAAIPSSGTYHTNDLTYLFNTNSAQSRYVGLTVTGVSTGELAPRLQMLSSPFALLAANSVNANNASFATNAANAVHANNADNAANAAVANNALNLDPNFKIQPSNLAASIGLWNVSGNDVYRASGNVGIGGPPGGSPLTFPPILGDKIGFYGANPSAGNYGIGIQASLLQIHTDQSVSDVVFGYGNSTNMTQTMRIKGNGNVGIGTATPAAKLDVAGIGQFSGGTQIGSGVATGFYGDGANHAIRTYPGGSLYFQSASGASTRMFIDPVGRVGIGTTSPHVPLEVSGAYSYTMVDTGAGTGGTQGYIDFLGDQGDHDVSGGNTWTANLSLLIDGFGAAYGIYIFSDHRIKKDITDSVTAKDLAAIEQLRVANYRMVDSANGGPAWRKGFIAQEVEKVIPGAVSRRVDFVPDIFALSKTAVYDPAGKTLTLDLSKDHGLKVGDRVRLHADGKPLELNVSAVPSAHEFVVEKCEHAPEKVFVYGREVNDFRTVDYDRIYTTGIGAIQELAKQVTDSNAEIARLQSEVAGLRTEKEVQLGHLTALEARLLKIENNLGNRSVRSERASLNEE